MAYVPASKLIDINALEEFRKKSQWRLSRDSDSVVLTGPKGETTSVDVGAINADKINSNTEKINSLQSDTVTIKNTLTAHGARITTLETDSLEVKSKITADEADIADLKANTLTVDSADIRYAAIDDLDAVNASIQSLETTKLSADDADIKYATIQNLSAATGRIDTLESTALTTDTADIRYASITNLNAATARISDLETTALTTDTADIRYATIANLNTEKARIDTLETDALTADTADLRYAAIGDLNAATARIGTLESDMITADQADLKYATIQNLNAANANIQSLQTDKLDASDLTAYQATVTNLLANKADIDLANIGTGVIKTAMIENGAITTALIGTGAVDTAQIADGSITDGKIVSLSATKISAGTLDAAKIDVVHLNAASITVGQINGTQIANGAIDLDQLSSGVANTISSNTANVTQALNDIGVLQDDVGTATADAQSAKATANSALTKINEAIQEVDVEYAVGDSSSTAPTTGWSTDSPQWQAGKYIWQRTKVVDGDDNISYSEPTCIQGAKGQNGQDGKDGKDGVSPTISASKTGTVTTLTITDSTGTSTATINDGAAGSRGTTWYAGTAITGTSTTAAVFSGSGVSSAIVGDHYLNTDTQNVYVCKKKGNASTATWAYEMNIKGSDGTPGTNGTDGKTAYLHVKYSNDGGATFTGNSGEDAGTYIGTYSDNTQADSTSVSKYTWVKIEGEDGADGVSPTVVASKSGTVTTLTITDVNGTRTATVNDGTNGSRGTSWYAGAGVTGTSTTAAIFSSSGVSSAIVGDHYLNTSTQNVYICKKAGNASTATWAYEMNIKGTDGTDGTNGIDGKTAYLHVKYSDDGGVTFTGNSGEDTGVYIGTYSDNTQADSTSVSAYKWVKIEGKDGTDGVSPTIVTSKSGTVTTLTITDVNGTRTATVNDGTNGSRGATWYAGTAITGTSTSATIFSGSGISSAIVGDHYLNTSTQNVYVCTKAGNASTATWKYEQNIKGASGTPGTNGTNGTDGKSAYLHVKYSNDGGTTFTSNSGEDTGSWIGTYTDDKSADSTSVSAYKWVKIEGTDGKDGKDGSRGATWYAGTAITGTSTTATKFTGSGITSAITGDHYLNTSTQNVYVCVTGGNASTATWKYEQNIKGATGAPGTNGVDGSTAYFHVKYSNDGGTTFTSNSGEEPGIYIGTYSDNTAADSTSVSKYTWVKIEGTDGKDGKDGDRGATWYAGTKITGTSTTATKFTGSGITSAIAGDHYLNTSTQNVYVCVVGGNASTATWKYEQNIKGATGQAGTNGTDGKTAYMHVKYSDDGGATFTSNSGEDPGSYIGTYSDNTAADSTSVSKYTWVRIEGLDGEDGVSPIITSSKSGTVTTITITDASGTKTATLNDGAAGARGATWYAGTKITGTSTTAAVFSGSGISSAIVGDHYLNTSTQNVYVCKKAGNASTATWAYEENIKGETGQAGTNGTNGKTAYFHVKYSNDGGATFTSNSGEDTGTYIGTYSDNNATDSTSVSAYKWVKIEGIDGEDGVSPTITTSKTGSVSTITIVDALGTKRVNVNDGVAGARGATWYAGNKITGTSTTATVFSGSGISNAIVGDHYLNTATQNVYVCAKAGAASTATWKYEQNIKGATGATGPTGPDGKTAYFHVKYSNDGGKTFTANSGETAGTYIGTYTDNTAADSTSVSKYTWVKIEGIDGEDGISITKVEEQYYLSTSDTTQTGGSWSTTQPAWSSGKYIWTRSHITFSNNTTSDTTPVLAKAINSANTTANSANTTAKSANTTANSAKTAADNAVLVATTAQTSADKALSSTEIIIGTQTAATGAWTGNASFATLEDGQSIIYWLPFAGSGNATLNLTLSTGLTTGAKNCYYSGASRLSTHYAAGNAIRLTYMKAANVNGTSYEGWWADANQNTDTYDRVRYNWSITAASAITAGQLLVADSNGKYKPLTTASFDVSKPILWAGSAIDASKTSTNNYIAYPNVNVTVTKSGFTGTNLATLYLYGTLSGSTFTPNSNLFTTTVPTSMTTDTYIAVGQMRSTTACYLYPEHPMYRYYNGKFQSITQLAYEAFISADTAQDKADAAQQTADSASGTANTALQTANGKNKVFHQASAPATGMQTNDTWFDTDDGYKMYRYNGSSWVAEQFNSNAIADAAITNAKIKDATIQSAKIATLDAGKITTGTLAADRIGANSITGAKIAAGTITSIQIASGTIQAGNIATGSITADLIGAGVISADHLASKSITSDKIVSGAVTADKIAANTITANKIASGTITAGLIASNAITAAKIAAGAVTAAKIGARAVTADKIDAGAVTAEKIDVSDLYALGATIGGFVINETSIASKDKSTNGGIQLNKDGSVDIGDSNSYIRYADGNLDMRVTSLTIGGSGVATAAQLTNMSDTVNSIATAANTTANSALVRAGDAAKTATNFLHYDSVYGLVVTQSPVASASAVANITDSNLRITSDSVDVFKGQKRLARYGANVILGDEDASNVLIDPSGGLQVRSGSDVLGSFSTSGVGLGVSRDNKPYMNINPEAFSIKQIIQVTDDSGSYPQVLDDDIFSISFNSDVTYGELGTESGDVLAMETGEALGYTEGEAIAQLQFGVENDSRGVGTAVFGEGLEAISRYSFAVGRYNKATGTDLFVVGNGNGDSTRSNALTIDKSGLVTIPGRIVNTATPTGNTDLVNKAYVDNAIKALYKLITGNNYPS